jgi:hippurate hydrolase
LIDHYEGTDSVYNDPALAQRLKGVLETTLGKNNVVLEGPHTASEDYSAFVQQGIPSLYFSLGGADPEKFEQAKTSGTVLPSNHSSLFAPDVEPALRTGITAEVAVLRDLLNMSSEELRRLTSPAQSK